MHLERNGESGLKIVKSFLGKMGSRQWVILLLLGLLLCVIALPVSGKKDTQGTGTTSDKSLFGSTEPESLTESTSLEKKLEELLSQVEGVGKVKVILMIGEDENCQEFYSSGKQKVTGVLISAQGADNSVVSRNIVEAVMALFEVEAHRIRVMKMK